MIAKVSEGVQAVRVNELEAAIRDQLQSRGLTFQVIHPKPEDANTSWMDTLIKECWDVAKDGFGRSLPYEAIDGRTREATLITTARDLTGRLVAYTVNDLLTLAGVSVNYWASAFDRRELKGKGMYGVINPYRCAAIASDAMMTRTQNPVVDHSFCKQAAKLGLMIFPNEQEGVPPEVVAVAKAFSPTVMENLVCKGIYDFGEPCGPRALMYDTPPPRTDRQKRIWANIDVEKGDATLLIAVPRMMLRE